MAGVKGPLFSLDASGTIGDAVVFAKWKGRNYVRRHAIPANPKSVGQVSVRAMMRFLSQQWAAFTANQKADWETRAAATNISEFNAFVAYNMTRWGQNLGASKQDPATVDGTEAVMGALTVTNAVRSLIVSQVITTANDNWGIMIYRVLGGGVGMGRNELVRVILGESAATFTWTDTDVTAGQLYGYDVRSLSDVGDLGSAVGEQTGTPSA